MKSKDLILLKNFLPQESWIGNSAEKEELVDGAIGYRLRLAWGCSEEPEIPWDRIYKRLIACQSREDSGEEISCEQS